MKPLGLVVKQRKQYQVTSKGKEIDTARYFVEYKILIRSRLMKSGQAVSTIYRPRSGALSVYRDGYIFSAIVEWHVSCKIDT